MFIIVGLFSILKLCLVNKLTVVNRFVLYPCDKQGYWNRLLDLLPIDNFVHRTYRLLVVP